MEREGRKCIGWKGEEKGRAGEKKGMEGMTRPPDFKTWIHVYVNDAHKKLYTVIRKCTSRYDTRRYFNVRSKANMSQFNLPHGTDN